MSDINAYTNDLLIKFLDACHDQIKEALVAKYGDSWLSEGVERHIAKGYLERAREMLASPMATVDMGKTDEEIYGVEHLSNIVIGNWDTFGSSFGKRNKTEHLFSEVAELRHNVSHRRQRHMLRQTDLLRFAQNATLLLRAFGSPRVGEFEEVVTRLDQGGSPWGNELLGALPPSTEIVPDFVGREKELKTLSEWIYSRDNRAMLVWGYGGSGKSALTYQFARSVRDSAPAELEAVIWLSAKAREFVEGQTRRRRPDFDSLPALGAALWNVLYDGIPDEFQRSPDGILQELNETPSLLIIDDLDTVLEDEELAHFLLHEIPRTKSKVMYTSRQRVYAVTKLDVEGFIDRDLEAFLRRKCREFTLDVEECLGRLEGIKRVTNGFPLFIDDLLRQARVVGLKTAMEEWSQRRGDAAREYALRRQFEALDEAAKRALIVATVANGSVSSLQMAEVAGFTDDDILHAIQDLEKWRLLSRDALDASGRPTFLCNGNTGRLMERTYGKDPLFISIRETMRNLHGNPVRSAVRRVVGTAIGDARSLVLRGDMEGAAHSITSEMIGELENNVDLWGALGWVYFRVDDLDALVNAENAFAQAHRLGARKEDTYTHWTDVRIRRAEKGLKHGDEKLSADRWREVVKAVEWGVERCGETASLCQKAAYVKSREGEVQMRLRQFTAARTCFLESSEWARRGLHADVPSNRYVDRAQLYRALVGAQEGAEDDKAVISAMRDWFDEEGKGNGDWQREYDRLAMKASYASQLSQEFDRRR